MGHVVSNMALPVLVEQFFIVIMGVINTMLASNLGKTAISCRWHDRFDQQHHCRLFPVRWHWAARSWSLSFTGHGDQEKANQTAGQALMSNLAIAGLVTLSLALLKKPLIALPSMATPKPSY